MYNCVGDDAHIVPKPPEKCVGADIIRPLPKDSPDRRILLNYYINPNLSDTQQNLKLFYHFQNFTFFSFYKKSIVI